jgi:Amt family ammonium transporter
LFATVAVNSAGFNGLFYGNPSQLVTQLIATVAAAAFAFVVTFILAKILDAVFGLSVSSQSEEVGLDVSEHGERAYS